MSTVAEPLTVVEIERVPYVSVEWLEKRIYRDEARAKRWRQEARRFAKRTDLDAIATHAAYRWHSLAMSYRVEKWKRCRDITISAIIQRQHHESIEFGLMIEDRRIMAGMRRRELAQRSGLDRKTILNIEKARFVPTIESIYAIIAIRELRLTTADVSPVLLEENYASAEKHCTPRKRISSHRDRQEYERCRDAALAAIKQSQQDARIEFGSMIRDRRIAVGMGRPELARRASLDRKTILNIEKARFAPSIKAIHAIISVQELHLTLADVNPVLLEEKSAGRK